MGVSPSTKMFEHMIHEADSIRLVQPLGKLIGDVTAVYSYSKAGRIPNKRSAVTWQEATDRSHDFGNNS